MMLKNAVLAVAVAAVVSFCGCKDVGHVVETEQVRSNGTYAVVIGMENSQFAGSCPGARYDATRMFNMISRYAGNATLLLESDATHDRVKKAMTQAADSADLFILYYSGHGGSSRFQDTGSEEEDGQDEYLCLYDTYMRDNEIWTIINRCKGRVFLVFDCCHSHTLFRLPSFRLSCAIRTLQARRDGDFRMQCWSGCPDDTYSYGSASGGELTNTLLKYFTDSITYDDLWHRIDNDANLKRFEDAQRTVLGESFGTEKVFR